MYHDRSLEPVVREALADTPVVVVAGPRQAGKSTLAEHVVGEVGGTWLTLDDAAVLAAAQRDPVGFVADRNGSLVGIDEAQRVPELLLAVKAEVDRDRRPGRFLMTGSTRLLGAPRLADSLAGRMEALTLWPFTQAELSGITPVPGFIDRAFAGDLSGDARPVSRSDVLDRAALGGYLPALDRTERRRPAWFDSYVDGVVDREVRSIADVTYLRELPRLLRLVAARTAGELNRADVARDLGLSRPTTDAYLTHLEAVFLVQTVPAWSTNVTSRVVRRPKVTVSDTGLACRLLGARARADDSVAGRIVETFVINELRAQAQWSAARPELFHFRDRDGAEVDLVLEAGDGRIVGVEVKAGATVRAGDLRGLRLLEARAGADLAAGVVLSTNPTVTHLGGKLWILPISALW